jgi:hypothetical protein
MRLEPLFKLPRRIILAPPAVDLMKVIGLGELLRGEHERALSWIDGEDKPHVYAVGRWASFEHRTAKD